MNMRMRVSMRRLDLKWLGRALCIALVTPFLACDFFEEHTQESHPAHREGANSFQMITGDDSDEERERWNLLFKKKDYVYGTEPASILQHHLKILPSGRALVIPMEEGRNAVYLAKNGFSVSGIDYSDIALQKANRLAKKNGVKLNGINADLNVYTIQADSYDVIVSVEFHRPRLIDQIKKGLRKNGVVVYQTYTSDQANNVEGPKVRRDFLLRHGELRELFKDFQILAYHETNDGRKALAGVVARKP
jgi:tellurite methyltransferase